MDVTRHQVERREQDPAGAIAGPRRVHTPRARARAAVRSEAGAAVEGIDFDRLFRHFLRWIRDESTAVASKKASTRRPRRPRKPDEIRESVVKLARENAWATPEFLANCESWGTAVSHARP
jgi:hypothetical protein